MKRQSLNPRGFVGGIKGMLTACLAILTLGFALPAGAQNNYAVTSVVIKAPSGSSVFESCPPANSQIDPDESVTVVVTFKNNNASAGPSDLTATLATTGGVNGAGLAAGFTVDLSEAIGALAAGASISKEFTFRASATNEAVNARFCGENLNMTFNLTGTGVAAAPTINVRLGVINNVITTFSNTGAIQINDSPAAATASSVVVSGLTSSNHLNDARISKVRVHLYGFTHSYTKDVDVVLVGPGGVKIAVMSDAGGVPGGTTAVNNINLTLDDAAGSNLPDGGQMVAGTFKPTDIEPAAGEISEVTGAYDTSFAALIGDDPKDLNGTWTLYVKDDQANDAGFLNGGWAIEITEELASCCIPGLPTIQDIANQTTNEDIPLVINFTVNDNETPLANLTLTAASTNTALVDIGGIVFSGTGGARTVTITPVLNQPLTAASATTKITITVKDGDQKTASDDFVVTVNQVNDFPTISDIGNVTTSPGTATAEIPFTIGDVETAVSSLSLFTTSSNTTLVPNANVVLGGSGANRTVKVTPAANQFGSSTITVGVVDGSGATTSDTFVVSVASPGDPTITNVDNQSMNEGTTLSVPIVVSDAETANKTNLVVTATSSNTTVVPNTTAGLFFNGGQAGAVNKPDNTTGALTLNIVPTGQLAAGVTATTTITLTVRDTDNRTATDTFVLTVTGVDDAPTISNITDRTTNEDVAVGAAFTVSDPDSATITVTGGSSNDTLIPDANILFSGTGSSRTVVVVPAANQFGTSTITITASSGTGTTSDDFVVTVLSVNDLPTATGYPSGLVEVLEDPNNGGGTNFVFTIADVETAVANLVVTASSSDPNVVQNAPAALALSNIGAVYTLKVTPVTDKNGKTFISVNIADRGAADDNVSPGSTTLTFQLDVKSVNDGPTFTLSPTGPLTVNEDTVATTTATITDIESGPGAVVLSFESSNTTLLPVARITETKVNDSTRTINMLAATNANGGPVTVKVIATNPNTGLKRTNSIDVTYTAVADAPTISNIPDATIGKNQILSAVAFTTTDPEGYGTPALTASIQSQTPGVGSPATLLLVNNILFGGSGDNRTLTVVPENNAHGTVVIRVTVNAADAATAFDDFTLTIQDRNSQPTITAIPNQNTVEDSITAPQIFTLGDLEDAANLNLLTVTAESSSNPDLIPLSNVFFGTTANPAERTVRVVPALNKSGTATITVAVTDRGLPVGSNLASNRTSFTVTVSEVPDAPTISAIANVSTNEDAVTVIAFTVNDAETPAADLIVTVVANDNSILPVAGLVLGGSGSNRTLTVTPAPNVPTTVGTLTPTITVTVKDASNMTASSTFTYSISNVNDAPTISDIADQQIAEDGKTGVLLFSIADADEPSTLTLFTKSSNTTLVPETASNIAITTTNLTTANRYVIVTPAGGKSGVATITIGVYDQNNLTNTDTFVVTVGSVNDLPTITNNNGNQVVPEDTALSLPVVIDDDETADADLKVSAKSSNQAIVPDASIVISPANNVNRTVAVTPVANATGVTTITIEVEDADGGKTQNVFTAEWTALNDAPTISAITDKTTAEDQPTAPIAVTVGDVETAAGDLVLTGTSTDTAKVPNQNIEFSGTGANRFVVVRPALDATGDVNITVTVTDGNGATASRQFKVTISAQSDAPSFTAAIADVTSAEDSPSPLIAFTVTDSDTAAGSLVVTATSSNTALVANNNIFIGANGGLRTMTLLPTANQFGSTIITVTVKDGNNLTASTQFTLTVTPVNDLPSISTIAAQNIPEDGATGELAFTVGDVETPVASLVLTKSSSNTTVVPTANVVLSGSGSARKVVVTAAPNRSGFSDVSITVIDSNDGRSTATFRVTVAEDNDAPSISDLANTTTPEGVAATVNFTVNDAETAPANLTIAATSSNTTLVPNANLVVSAGGTVRTLTVTPVAGLSGTSTITVTVTDASNATASDSFELTVTEVNRNDFNGDGLSDILFQNPDGTMAAFFMNGADRIGTSFLNPNNPGDSRWKIAGTSDFNGDGKGDILFQHQDGTLSAWYMDGINFTGNALLNPSSAGDAGWRVVATADFDVDGKDDLLFQHSSGDLSIWYMNGINLRSSVLVNPSNAGDTRWIVVGATDVDKDSRADILFQHTDGTLAAWFMNGANRTGFDVLNPENPGPDWRVSAIANFGQSSQNDLILQNINGDMQVWYMNGTHGEMRKLLNPPNSGVDWFVVGPK